MELIILSGVAPVQDASSMMAKIRQSVNQRIDKVSLALRLEVMLITSQSGSGFSDNESPERKRGACTSFESSQVSDDSAGRVFSNSAVSDDNRKASWL